MAPVAAELWKVVGGATGFGIVVRTGKKLSSPQAMDRLSTGAEVQALEYDEQAGRLHYVLVKGEGPASGWVSTEIQGKALLVRISQNMHDQEEGTAVDSQLEEKCMEASQQVPVGLVHAELERNLGVKAGEPKVCGKPGRKCESRVAEDSDGEEVHLCAQCGLPLGEKAYKRDGTSMHGECVAQLMIQAMRDEEEAHQNNEKAKKAQRRLDYDLRWSVAQIPRNNDGLAKKLVCPTSEGMVCMLLNETDMSASLAPTTEPAASVNLEYLSLALKVRRQEGREPVFSLDPSGLHKEHAFQEKVFVPEWIADTSMGEVMFQADYHLKELSMGEFDQPVLGMRSCFDFAESEGFDKEWSGREWFHVRDAEMHVANGGILLPHVKMGVQAREQVMVDNGLNDAPLTRFDHPLVKYADSFTHNFDLIAERKSVIYHLRELAKATILAKFLMDFNISTQESWFQLADESKTICSQGWEVPQLWNERMHSKVEVKDGTLVDAKNLAEKGPIGTKHGIYGGIDFGLDNFSLAAGLVTRMGRPGRRTAGLSTFELTGATPLRSGVGRPAALSMPGALPAGVSMPTSYLAQAEMADLGRPQGVDLSLDKFNFMPKRVTLEASAIKPLDVAATLVGASFWSGIDGDAEIFKEEDKELLKDIYNPHLSDRRSEGDCFTMPDTSLSRMEKLRALVNEEERVRQQRKQYFCSEMFSAGDPGPLFPSTWTSSISSTHGGVPLRAHGALYPRPKLLAAAPALKQVLKSASAVFSKSTEDGLRFRIYTLGNLEIRTIQEHGEEELVGVFSISAPEGSITQTSRFQTVEDYEKIVKFTEYVEQADGAVQLGCRIPSTYYLVLETDQGHRLVAEQTSDGKMILEEASSKLDDRTSFAKVTRSTDCKSLVTVQDLKAYCAAAKSNFAEVASLSTCKRFARETYSWLSVKAGAGTPSQFRPAKTNAWQASSEKASDLQLMAKCLAW